jgi:intracellular sulfur oxidation DsrE/DsrF family protein
MDINFNNILTVDGDFLIRIDDIPIKVEGNRALANIFEITFLTNVNDSLMSYGYGGDGVGTVSKSYDPNDLQSIAAAIKVACDNTVTAMQIDQSFDTSIVATEKIVSARVMTVTKTSDRVSVSIDIIPEEYDSGTAQQPIVLTLPL